MEALLKQSAHTQKKFNPNVIISNKRISGLMENKPLIEYAELNFIVYTDNRYSSYVCFVQFAQFYIFQKSIKNRKQNKFWEEKMRELLNLVGKLTFSLNITFGKC